MIDTSIFNPSKNYESTNKTLFLNGEHGLLDSIHRPHPELFRLYKLLKSLDWDELEFPLESCQAEFMRRPKSLCNKMIQTLSYQWEADSVAAHSIAPVIAPFVSDTDLWLAYSKISENEGLHALAYSEIVKYGLGGDTKLAMAQVLENQEVLKRLRTVANALGYVKKVGAKLTLGLISPDSDEAIDAAMLFVCVMLVLERVQFMPSFAVTFAIGEISAFIPIVKTVQKICTDEYTVHILVGKYVLGNEQQVPRSIKSLERIRSTVETVIDEVRTAELNFIQVLHEDGEELPGATPKMLGQWVDFAVTDVYNVLKWKNPFPVINKNPLGYMSTWIDQGKSQGSPQETREGGYLLGGFVTSTEPVVFDIDDL